MATTKLPPYLRRVLYLRISGMTDAEIADEMGIKLRTARTYLKRLRGITLSGITDWGDGSRKWVRMAYVIGLVDGGVSLEELPKYLQRFEDRVSRPHNDAFDEPEPVLKPHHNWHGMSR